MAGPAPGSGDALALGLFGTFQEAAAAHASTSTIWSQLRQAAGKLPFGEQPRNARGQFISREEYGAQVLRQAGVGVTQVNTMRAAAGAWLTARTRLMGLPLEQNIAAEHVFTPEWRTTGIGRANPAQYRLRILRGLGQSGAEGTQYEQWSTYDLGGSLGSMSQVIARSNQAYGRARYSSGTFINEILAYEIEVI